MDGSKFQPGDWVIYRKTKHSSKPGERACHVTPAPNGDSYSYTVDKFWIVTDVKQDGTVTLRTRKGKTHIVNSDTQSLKRPNWFQRWWHRFRFEAVASSAIETSQ